MSGKDKRPEIVGHEEFLRENPNGPAGSVPLGQRGYTPEDAERAVRENYFLWKMATTARQRAEREDSGLESAVVAESGPTAESRDLPTAASGSSVESSRSQGRGACCEWVSGIPCGLFGRLFCP